MLALSTIQPLVLANCDQIAGQSDVHDDACFMKTAHLSGNKRRASAALDLSSPSPDAHVVSGISEPSSKRQRTRSVSFVVDEANKIKHSLKTFEKDYCESDNENIWWSESDLTQIMMREGRLMRSINKNKSSSLRNSLNATYKTCADVPLATGIPVADDNERTTRGLERYIAPIMSAHSKMSILSVLKTQKELAHLDISIRQEVLRARYQHLSKISTNFAIVLAECDARIAST